MKSSAITCVLCMAVAVPAFGENQAPRASTTKPAPAEQPVSPATPPAAPRPAAPQPPPPAAPEQPVSPATPPAAPQQAAPPPPRPAAPVQPVPPAAAPQPPPAPAPEVQSDHDGTDPDRERARVERDRERDRALLERERQRAERDRERGARERERELDRAQRERDRALAHAERARAEMQRELLRADAIHSVFAKRRGYLGVVVLEIGPRLRGHFGAPADSGVLVNDVTAGGPAQRAGVAVGDVLVSIGGSKVASTGDVRRLVADAKEGTEVKLGVLRGGKSLTLTAKVVEREMPQVMLDLMPPSAGCVPSIDPDAIREMVERKIELRRGESPERMDELERRLKELQDKLQKLQEKLQGNVAPLIPSRYTA